eukprot:4486473-Alexandrium_andersonii.AAC.1
MAPVAGSQDPFTREASAPAPRAEALARRPCGLLVSILAAWRVQRGQVARTEKGVAAELADVVVSPGLRPRRSTLAPSVGLDRAGAGQARPCGCQAPPCNVALGARALRR